MAQLYTLVTWIYRILIHVMFFVVLQKNLKFMGKVLIFFWTKKLIYEIAARF